MDGAHFIAALASALHALWNAAIKASANPRQAMTAQMIAAAVLALLGLVWAVPPPLAAWPWMLVSTRLNMCAVPGSRRSSYPTTSGTRTGT